MSLVAMTASVRHACGLCSIAHVSGALGMKHLVAQFGLTLTCSCLALGLIYLGIVSGRDAHLVFGLGTCDYYAGNR
jgi:hypothetical protein